MAAVLHPTGARSDRQRYVDSLLDELEERRRQLYRLKAGGALPAGLRDLKREFAMVQRRLTRAVCGPDL